LSFRRNELAENGRLEFVRFPTPIRRTLLMVLASMAIEAKRCGEHASALARAARHQA
jgi:hypothetical protein